jgi:O-antigen/teichoic acid export membrane protein
VKNQLRSGVILSYLNLAISCLIPFLYTPIMLDMLGQAEYGLYSLANSVVGYLSLLSFGFGSTIIRYLSKYRAEKNQAELEKTYGFFLLLYAVLALAILLGGLVIQQNVATIFGKGLLPDEVQKMKQLVMIMALNLAISFPLSVFSSVAIAHERYLFRKIMDIVSTVAAPLANLVALYLGYASVGMALAGTVIQCVLAPISVFYCSIVLKITPRFGKMPSKLIREMLGFSVFVFLGTLVDMLFWATDKIILGMLASSVAVAVYNVGGTFNTMVMSLSTSISGVLVPRITGMVTTDSNRENWTELFIKVGRIQFLIIGLIVSGFAVFGQTFIHLWAGPE